MTKGTGQRGTTLIEIVVAITVLGIVAGVSLPVVHGATEAYAGAAQARRTSEHAAFALERIMRLLRDAPSGENDGALLFRETTSDGLVFTDGRGVRLQDHSLVWVEPDGTDSTLCENVDRFEIQYVADDGRTDVGADPSRTHRFHIELVVGGFELRTCVLARSRVTP